MFTNLLATAPRLPEGWDAWMDQFFGYWRCIDAGRYFERQAHSCALTAQALANADASTLQQLGQRCHEGLRRDPHQGRGELRNALALIGVRAQQILGMTPYQVQFMGALALQQGWLAEMATGEGKTLTVAMAAILTGWSGRTCHVITANDYLANRDAEQMAPLFNACGVSVAAVIASHHQEERQQRYNTDVVYVTAKTLLADFLRDQLAAQTGVDAQHVAFAKWLGQPVMPLRPPDITGMLQRGLHTALVDEADSVLIDEAVTPLILSAPRPLAGLHEGVRWAHNIATQLRIDQDFVIDQRNRTVQLKDGAAARMDECQLKLPPAWQPLARRVELLRQALMVRYLFRRGHHYLVRDEQVVLIDEFTGRMTPGRTLTAGLHQAIEAYEGIPLTDPNESLGQMSFQGFFRRLRHLAGTTGTAHESATELWCIYHLPVLPVPTNKPRQTKICPLRLFAKTSQKWQALIDEIIRMQHQGQPVLVGVRSVTTSQSLANLLWERGFDVALLNAEQDAVEANIIVDAGHTGRITIATNMAGRGTDICLDEVARQAGGLHVIIAECNESARIDRQLAGRCGRQGDPGSVITLLSIEDSLPRRYASSYQSMLLRLLCHTPQTVAGFLGNILVRQIQQRAEGDAFEQRRAVLRNDNWLESALPFS